MLRQHERAMLVNNVLEGKLDLLESERYWLLECYPTSTWRRTVLRALPGKTNPACTAAVISAFARALWQNYSLPNPFDEWAASHDDLQAVVAALPAAALLGGPCGVVPMGQTGRWIEATEERPTPHWIEGFIWDASLPDRNDLEPMIIPHIEAHERPAEGLFRNDNPLLIEDLDHGAGADAIGRGVRLFHHLAELSRNGQAVGIGYKRFACFVHGVGNDRYEEIAGRVWGRSDGMFVLQLAHQITEASGGNQHVGAGENLIQTGMDAFIWQQRPPHNRNAAAFVDAPSEAAWRAVFPDGHRRLITERELLELLEQA
jgi:hypothetical protein